MLWLYSICYKVYVFPHFEATFSIFSSCTAPARSFDNPAISFSTDLRSICFSLILLIKNCLSGFFLFISLIIKLFRYSPNSPCFSRLFPVLYCINPFCARACLFPSVKLKVNFALSLFIFYCFEIIFKIIYEMNLQGLELVLPLFNDFTMILLFFIILLNSSNSILTKK